MCIHKFINKFSVVLCLVFSWEPVEYRHKSRPSCPFNFRQHLGKLMELISRFTAGATITPALIFASDNFGYSS